MDRILLQTVQETKLLQKLNLMRKLTKQGILEKIQDKVFAHLSVNIK